MNSQFSFIILTYNEEIHLPRLLDSIRELDAPVFVLDSGSNDATLSIATGFGVKVLQHSFENHPKQWDFALKNFPVITPWVICLDADQVVTPELKKHLSTFRDEDFAGINGIYFNRKNFFKGRQLKHGGYSPFYLLKMFRYGTGYSDLNEGMDHRFVVPGKTIIWKDGYIIEENLKENQISFWIAKHNRYSDLVAREEVERLQRLRIQTVRPRIWGSPDERTAWLKQMWWQLPLYARPALYFLYRMFFRLGILDGRTGVIFHFLQGFWFRLVVDVKMDEILIQQRKKMHTTPAKKMVTRFVVAFLVLFAAFYYFNIFFFNLTTPTASFYIPFIARHFDYIAALRSFLLSVSAGILQLLGFYTIHDAFRLLTAGRGVLVLDYSCLGLGVISFFAAFVLAYPTKRCSKVLFLIAGIAGIELLNIFRLVLLAVFWDARAQHVLNHHTIFNIVVYLIIAITLYFWVKHDDKVIPDEANNGSFQIR